MTQQLAPKTRRIGVSSIRHAPADPRERHRRKVIQAVGVGLTMLVIVGLYVASFGRQELFQEAREAPRWGILSADVFRNVQPVAEQLQGIDRIKQSLASLIQARQAQMSAVQILKAKIESSATATKP